MPQKGIWGSNPHLSAILKIKHAIVTLNIILCCLIYADSLFARHQNQPGNIPYGGVAEWLNAAVSKTVLPATRVTRVRIPPPPPDKLKDREAKFAL